MKTFQDVEVQGRSGMNFRQWLEIVGFHGSSEDFDEFDPKMIGQAKKTSISKLGFFFAPSREEANIYADLAQGGDGFIGKWEIDIQNPYNMSYEEFNDLIDWGSLDQQKHKSHQEAEAATIAKRKELEEQGYDGIYIRNYAGTKIAEIVIFSPHQAKKVDVEPGINVWEQ